MNAGLLIRQTQQVQEQGWEKRGKEERETSVEVSHSLGVFAPMVPSVGSVVRPRSP